MRKIAALLAAALLVLVGCSGTKEQRAAGDEAIEEQRAVTQSLNRMLDAQPVPRFDFSQERQTLIDVLTLRAQGANTTSLFMLNGIGVVAWCPSIGSSVPETTQLTNSQQYVNIPAPGGGRNQVPVDQMEQTGVYPGDTEGTWTVCLDDNGKKFGVRWEAPVSTVTGTLKISEFGDNIIRLQPTDLTFEFTE